jgi:hypothetical protein
VESRQIHGEQQSKENDEQYYCFHLKSKPRWAIFPDPAQAGYTLISVGPTASKMHQDDEQGLQSVIKKDRHKLATSLSLPRESLDVFFS